MGGFLAGWLRGLEKCVRGERKERIGGGMGLVVMVEVDFEVLDELR